MISICIPIYNCQVYNLAISLVEQCFTAQIEYEIIFIDDASGNECTKFNKALGDINHVFYIELTKNIGRSAIRNLFLNYAKYDHLLFLDCDSEIPDNQFVQKYIESIKEGANVVCGGRTYGDKPENKWLLLRWEYGTKRESTPACDRMKKPHHSFLSNNFLIRKEIFKMIKFDERIAGYGHEDTLFGYRLWQNNISIAHIENPTIHKYLESASVYLNKTRQAIENLYFIYHDISPGIDFSNSVKLLKYFIWIKKNYLRKFLALFFIIIRPAFNFFLEKGKFRNLKLFDLYKLGYMCYYSAFGHQKFKPNH